jgi:hypothetical protein
MPFFTPEQVAQAYIGPGAGINDQIKLYQAQLAEQKKLDIEAAKKNRAEQMTALMDLNKVMADSKLGTGTALDEAHNQRSQAFYSKYTTGAGKELYKADPQAWQMAMRQEAPTLISATENYKAGVKDLNDQLKTLSAKYNNSLQTSPVRSALINRLKYKNNGQYPDYFQVESQDVNDVLSGRINSDGSETNDPLQQRANMTLYHDKGLNQTQVLEEYSKMKLIPAENVVNKGGVKIIYSGKISPFDRVNKKENKVELDLVPATLSNGDRAEVLSDRAFADFDKYPKMKIARAHYEQDLLQNPQMVDLKARLNEPEWQKILTAQYVKNSFPAEQTLTQDKQDIASAEQRRRQEWSMNYNKDKEAKPKGDYWTLASAARMKGIPTGAYKVDTSVYGLKNPALAGADLYDITDYVGGKELKNRNNFPVRILKDAKTGKTYYVTNQYTSAGGTQVQPTAESSSFTTDADTPVEFNSNDESVWLGLANPQDYSHKSIKEFQDKFNTISPLAGGGAPDLQSQAPTQQNAQVPAQQNAQVTRQAAAQTPAASTDDYGAYLSQATKDIMDRFKKASSKKSK